MQATDFGNRDDGPGSRGLDWPPVGRVLDEREMRTRLAVVREVAGQDPSQVSFAQDENMIEAFPPDRTDQPFREGILPRAVWGGDDFLDAHAPYAAPKLLAVDGITIT